LLEFISHYWVDYLVGLGLGLFIAVSGMLVSIVLGTIGALGRRASIRWIALLATAYVAVFRALPPLLMLYIVYFGLPTWAAASGNAALANFLAPLNNRLVSAIFAFGITSGAYSTEIIRGAIASVADDQIEAARSIGLSYSLTFRHVIAPQALRVAFPTLANEFIAVLKGTSLASVIGVVELMRVAQLAASTTFESLLAYSLAGVYYVAIVIVLQLVLTRVERRFDYPGAGGARVKAKRHMLSSIPLRG
jgi:His/Glu/Gln/Arg/opine family amino acid ABC transporter permease subunit